MDNIGGELSSAGTIRGILSPVTGLSGFLSAQPGVTGSLSVPERVNPDAYDGSYVIVPTASPQKIPVADLLMLDDITVEAIPHNYGLISWNGAYLSIS